MGAHSCLLAVALFICGVGDAEIETQRNTLATNSSVLFPGLKNGTKFTGNMIYELRKVGANPGWLMMYHGAPIVQKFYQTRGQFFPENMSFLLTNLRKEDSGVYEQKLNQKTLLRVVLTVADPVEEPVLRRQDDENGTCHITLLCAGWKGDKWTTTFSRNGVEIARNLSLVSSDNLVIDGTNPQDWGIYTCTVTNLVSQRSSQELALIPEEPTAASRLFYASLIGGVLYISHLICLVLSCKDKMPSYRKSNFVSKCICGAIMESIAVSIIIYSFLDHRDQLSNVGVTVSAFLVLVRVSWLLMICGAPLPSMIIKVLEDVLLAADVLLVPAIFICYLHLHLQGSDLCGKRAEQRPRALFYLVIGFVIFLAVALPLRISYDKCRKTGPPDPAMGPFIPGQEKGETDHTNDGGRKDEPPEKEALTDDETPT